MNDDIRDFLHPSDGDENQSYEAVWVDHFWGWQTEGMVFAPTLEDAIRRAIDHPADGLPIDRLEGHDGIADSVSGGHDVRAARVLVEVDGSLVEDVVPALTLDMAIDIAGLMFGESATILGVQEGGHTRELEPFAVHRERSDWPFGW